MITTLLISTIILLLGAGYTVVLKLGWWGRQTGYGISILVPFQCSDSASERVKNWEWLERYWKAQLPGAEVIMGRDYEAVEKSIPFSKSVAVNNAASKASGDIFVIVDADGYIPAEYVLQCADEIRRARKRGHRLWFVPYRQFYRLNAEATQQVLQSNPYEPYQFPSPPDAGDVQDTTGSQKGHWFGALIQIVPSEAFDIVGGWDARFRGWGGEDHAAMRAFDTLYSPHKTLPTKVLHLWHPMLSPKGSNTWVDWKSRTWEGQDSAGANDALSGRYYEATGSPSRMRRLVEEGLDELFEEIERDEHHHHHRHRNKSV
jgi:glycosyltransferase involved in cell wall biosynthesis